MNTTITSIAVACLGLGTLASAATPHDAVVRIIRTPDVQMADTNLPESYSGCLISRDGYIVTDAAVQGEGGAAKDFIIYVPMYDDKGDVNNLSSYRAEHVASENGLAVLKVSGDHTFTFATLPQKDITEPAATFACVGFRQIPTANDVKPESYPDINNGLRNGIDTDVLNTAIKKYMTPQFAPGLTAVPARAEGGRSMLTVGLGQYKHEQGFKGAPLFSRNGNGDVIGICIGEDNEAVPASYIRNIAENHYIHVGTGAAAYLGFIRENAVLLIGGLVLVIVLIGGVIFIITRPGKPTPNIELIGQDGTRYTVTGKMVRHRVVLGRSHNALLRFNNEKISRKHAHMCLHEGKVSIMDDNSTHGTYVNNNKLTPGQPVHLHRGDIIRLADYTIQVK